MSAPLHENPKRSKRSRAKESVLGGVQFLTFSHPQDWSSKENRLAVRSHVTRRQHQLSRAEIITQSSNPEQVPHALSPVGAHSASLLDIPRPATAAHWERKSVASLGDVHGHEKRHSWQPGVVIPSQVDDWFVLASKSSNQFNCSSPWRRSGEQLSYLRNSSISSFRPSQRHVERAFVADHQHIPVLAHPLNSPCDNATQELLFASMEDYMSQSFAPMAFPALCLTPDVGRLWIDTLGHHSRIEPSLRLTRLLFAAGHLCQKELLRPQVRDCLHQWAIAEISTALRSNERRSSEGIILAIGRLAFYESMFGDQRLAHEFHRPAQQRLVSQKGGIDKLKLPESVKYLMRWADIIMSLQSGSGTLLSGSPRSNGEVQPDVAAQSLKALAVWLPEQHMALLSECQLRQPAGFDWLDPQIQINPLLL